MAVKDPFAHPSDASFHHAVRQAQLAPRAPLEGRVVLALPEQLARPEQWARPEPWARRDPLAG